MMEALKHRDWKALGLFLAMVMLNCAYARCVHGREASPPPLAAGAEACSPVAAAAPQASAEGL